jgi:hypothetical protein
MKDELLLVSRTVNISDNFPFFMGGVAQSRICIYSWLLGNGTIMKKIRVLESKEFGR